MCARALSVVHRASVRSTRTPHRLRTRNRSSLFRCFPPWCPASTPAPSEHMRLPCLPHDCGFVRVPFFTVARRRRPDADLPPICLPPLHPARFTARDCLILGPRAGLPLSRDTSSALSSLQPLVVPYLHAAECMHAAQASLLLSCSQDDGDAHQLCSGEDECPQRLHHVGGVFPGRDQDRVGIVRQHDHSLGFWCAGAL